MPKKQSKFPIKKAFSLVELSIVILIVSILITGSLGISKTAITNSKVKVTKERMDIIYKAFTNYLATNRRIPCPATMSVAKGTASTYGAESATPGTCSGAYISSNASNLVYGMVPILELGLDPEIAEDGFGNKFVYVADKRFTKASVNSSSTDGFEIIKSVPSGADNSTTDLSGIDIQGPSGTSLLSNKNGVLLLLSHGANKFKGFNATGTTQDATNGVVDENNNSCDQNLACNSSTSTASFDRIFVVNSTDANFDDIVMFKNKTQLVRDAGLEFIMCNASEATASGPINWTVNGSYGCSVCSNAGGNARTCGKYGSWGASSTSSCTTNNVVCSLNRSAMELISTQVLSANATSVSFNSIPSTYTQLKIIGSGGLVTGGTVSIRFNGDSTAANYISQYLRATDSTTSSGYNATGIYALIPISDWTNVANHSSVFEALIPRYSSTSFFKTIVSTSGSSNSTGPGSITEIWSGTWRNTAAITSITLVEISGGSFAAGSSFSLYGMY